MKAEISRLSKAAAAGAVVLAMAACASTPVPNDKIAVAQESLRRAEQSGAPEFAPVELAAAREKLARAEKSAADHDSEPATMLAEQADIDARLAEATANEHRAHKAAAEFDASMAALRQESMRATPPAQTTPPAQ